MYFYLHENYYLINLSECLLAFQQIFSICSSQHTCNFCCDHTVCISGQDMVKWLQGKVLDLPFLLTGAIFMTGMFKVKQNMCKNSSLCSSV